MNIKKNVMKTMCAALACTTIMSNLISVYAAEAIITESPMDESVDGEPNWNTEESNFEEIEVTYKQSSSYIVTIPKTIALGTNKQAVYSVKVTGDIDTNQRVYVAPVDGISSTENIDFYMKDQTPESKKADVVATVTQNRLYWNSDDVASGHEETNNSISAPDLTTGNWKGTFQVAINLETIAEHVHNYVDGVCTGCGEKDPNAEHEHNYIDGKCDCGAIDPDHTHNYEDGKCTICGKETDPYETAPANEHSDWDYTLDDENDIITLNYYKGSKTDVIVYANYVIGEKTYKTQIANAISFGRTYMFANKENIKTVKFSDSLDTSTVTNMEGMFYYCKSLTSVDFGNNFDTSNVTDMSGMFEQCEVLTDLDVSRFNTGSVTDMTQMFANCKSLLNLDVSNFNTGNVTNMNGMFGGCTSLTKLDLSSFDTSNVINMNNMFSRSTLLTEINLSSFNTSNVTNMSIMFGDCSSLASLDLSSFDTSNVISMSSMFEKCSALEELDLSSFDTGNVTNMQYMFRSASNLKTIYATSGKWSTAKAGSTATYMFYLCGTSSVTYK